MTTEITQHDPLTFALLLGQREEGEHLFVVSRSSGYWMNNCAKGRWRLRLAGDTAYIARLRDMGSDDRVEICRCCSRPLTRHE